MRHAERRYSPRFNPKGIKASINLESQEPSSMTGEVLDISYTGIKIRLHTPIRNSLNGKKIRIELVLPESGIPLTISGILKHQDETTDLGIEYVENSNVVDMDKFMLECFKLVKSN